MGIGDEVWVDAQIDTKYRGDKRTIYRLPYSAPVRCMFLGWSQIQEGTVRSSYEGEDGYEPAFLAVEKVHRVAVVQPVDDHNRYRRPIRAFPDDVSPVPF